MREAAGEWIPGKIYYDAEHTLARVLGTVRDFVTDARAVLARNRLNCCVCGRGLSDELSRSRGVGPECARNVEWFAFLTNPTIDVEPGTGDDHIRFLDALRADPDDGIALLAFADFLPGRYGEAESEAIRAAGNPADRLCLVRQWRDRFAHEACASLK